MITNLNKLSFLNKIENQFEKIDALNSYAWEIRRSNPKETLEISKNTFDFSDKMDYQEGIAFSLKNSGTAYYLITNYELGINDLNKSRIIYRGLADKRSEADCLRYLGNIYHSIEEFDLSIDLYEKAKLISEEINDKMGIAYNIGNIGYVHFLCNKYVEAQDYLFKTYELLYDLDDTLGLADVLNNIGKNHFELKENEQALKCYRISLNLSLSINHLRGISNSFNNIGLYYLHSKDVKEALHYFTNALEVAKTMGENALISTIYKNFSTSYELIKDFENSLCYFKLHDALKAEIIKTSNINKIIANQVQFDLDQIELDKEIVQLKFDAFENYEKETIEKNVKLELLSLVASQSDNIVIIMNALGEINFVNESFLRLNGYNLKVKKEYIGKTIFEISNHPDIVNIVKDSILRKKSVSYESLNITEDGNKFYGSALLTPVFNEENKLINLIIVENDISERKKAEEIIDQKNQDITSSITYAKRIQEALFPSKSIINEYFAESFIINQPKDIVSGDFYWFDQVGNHITFAIADCTGHGVPGAFMSMIGINLLNQIINDSSVTNPAKVLHSLDDKIKKALKQTGENNETTDGMDIAFFEFNLEKRNADGGIVLNFASAYRPLWLIREGVLLEVKPDKQSIGGSVTTNKIFTNNSIDTRHGDVFYVFTDGCTDQFGGVNGKKFRTSGLQELLIEIHQLPMCEQEQIITDTLNYWKGDLEQVDDILIMGFKIK